eukprot:Awhi_evm1s157
MLLFWKMRACLVFLLIGNVLGQIFLNEEEERALLERAKCQTTTCEDNQGCLFESCFDNQLCQDFRGRQTCFDFTPNIDFIQNLELEFLREMQTNERLEQQRLEEEQRNEEIQRQVEEEQLRLQAEEEERNRQLEQQRIEAEETAERNRQLELQRIEAEEEAERNRQLEQQRRLEAEAEAERETQLEQQRIQEETEAEAERIRQLEQQRTVEEEAEEADQQQQQTTTTQEQEQERNDSETETGTDRETNADDSDSNVSVDPASPDTVEQERKTPTDDTQEDNVIPREQELGANSNSTVTINVNGGSHFTATVIIVVCSYVALLIFVLGVALVIHVYPRFFKSKHNPIAGSYQSQKAAVSENSGTLQIVHSMDAQETPQARDFSVDSTSNIEATSVTSPGSVRYGIHCEDDNESLADEPGHPALQSRLSFPDPPSASFSHLDERVDLGFDPFSHFEEEENYLYDYDPHSPPNQASQFE